MSAASKAGQQRAPQRITPAPEGAKFTTLQPVARRACACVGEAEPPCYRVYSVSVTGLLNYRVDY